MACRKVKCERLQTSAGLINGFRQVCARVGRLRSSWSVRIDSWGRTSVGKGTVR